MSTVEIANVQAIKELVFDLPDDSGGVLVFKGHNAVGKSTAIECVNALVSRKGRLRTRDHAIKGTAAGFGSKLSVAAQNRFTGDPEAASLSGRFDFADVVCPPEKDPEARERRRIKALLGLTGAKADPALFYALAGSKEAFEKLLDADDLETDDLVLLAGRVHRAFHAAAKAAEGQADHERGHAKACKEAAEGVDLNAPSEASALAKAWECAVAEHNRLLAERKAADDAGAAAFDAQAKLDAAASGYTGLSVEDAGARLQTAAAALIKANAAVEKVKEEIAVLQSRLATLATEAAEAKGVHSAAFEAKRAADQHASTLASWQEQVSKAATVKGPSDEELKAALKAREQAQEAVEYGAKVRAAKDKSLRANGHEKSAKEYESEAERLREAARSVDHVLSSKIPAGPLRAEGGRLVLDTERGEGVPFDECSDGERWSVALPYGIDAVGKGGIIPVPQDAWQHLDNANRAMVAELCREHFVWLITGEVANGELRAEVYSPDQSAV